MATINQLVRKPRSPETYKSTSPALANCLAETTWAVRLTAAYNQEREAFVVDLK